ADQPGQAHRLGAQQPPRSGDSKRPAAMRLSLRWKPYAPLNYAADGLHFTSKTITYGGFERISVANRLSSFARISRSNRRPLTEQACETLLDRHHWRGTCRQSCVPDSARFASNRD